MSCVEYLLAMMIYLATRLPPFDGWSFGYFSQFPLSLSLWIVRLYAFYSRQ